MAAIDQRGPSDNLWIGAPPETRTPIAASLSAFLDLNIQPWLPASRTAGILDFGCGAGAVLEYLQKHGYNRLTAFDPDVRFADFCKVSLPGVVVADPAEPLCFLRANRARFDCIICREVLYYVPRNQLQELVAALAGALRVGGRLITQSFNPAGIAGLWPLANDPYIVGPISEHLLRSLAERSGLRVRSLRDERYRLNARRGVWLLCRLLARTALKASYILQRGIDDQNPTLFGKTLILVADQNGVPDALTAQPA